MKLEGQLEAPIELGLWSEKEGERGKRTDLMDAIETMRERGLKAVATDHPEAFVKYHRGLEKLRCIEMAPNTEPLEVNLLYGPTGCGKSRLARQGLADYWVDPIGSGTWFDGYDGEEDAIFDDFDGNKSHWRLKDWLRVTDRYTLRVPIKGSFIIWKPKRIWITTNYHPRDWWDWTSREAQFPALKRRITRVYLWTSQQDGPFILDSAGRPDAFDRFFEGPGNAAYGALPALGAIDQYVVQPDPPDQWNFVPAHLYQ